MHLIPLGRRLADRLCGRESAATRRCGQGNDVHSPIKEFDRQGVRSASVEMGRLLREKGDLKKASFWYRRAIRADPKYGDANIFLGDIAFKGGLLNQAERFFRKALDCSAQSIDEAHFNLGIVLLAKKRYREVIKCYRKAIEIDPKYSIAKKRLKDAELALQLKNS